MKNGLNGGEYNDVPKADILCNATIHFVPMCNPDGVEISQFGADAINNANLRNTVLNMGCNDFEQWKANAEGTDINRNFDAGWDEYNGSAYPASERYKGEYPGSSTEAAALISATEKYNFKRTISYHTCGALIYWYYLQDGDVLEESRSFAEAVSFETGYPLDGNYAAVDAAGYKDWAVYKMGIPSITIEVGCENGDEVTNPVSETRFPNIWERNKNVVYTAIVSIL